MMPVLSDGSAEPSVFFAQIAFFRGLNASELSHKVHFPCCTRIDTPPNSSDFLPVFHANYCKKSRISLKRFSHDDKIVTMPFIEESAQNQCGQAASMGIPVGCVRITKIKAALHPIGFMQDCLRKCEESIFI